MLVITRQDGQSVQIGDARVTVRLDRSRHGLGVRVRLAIEAPPDVPVTREELGPVARQRIRERAAAAVKGVRP